MKPESISFKSTFNLNLSIQSLSQKVWVSSSYEKCKLDEDLKTHTKIKEISRFLFKILKWKLKDITGINTFVVVWVQYIIILFSFNLKTSFLFCRLGLTHLSFDLVWPVWKLISHLLALTVGKITSHLLAQVRADL